RQEERHHDDRLCTRRGAQGRESACGGHLSSLPAAIPADHDDNDGCSFRRHTARVRWRNRLRIAPAARHCHRRWSHLQPAPDAVYDTGDLSRIRSTGAAFWYQTRSCRTGASESGGGSVSLSSPFIQRPVATTLLTAAVAFAGALAYLLLPVSPLPQVEFPTIQVSASVPGASPETMASSVAMPLERQFARIAGVDEMTSSSNLGSTSVVLQFDLNRDIDAAARDVQAAINAARSQLPANLPNNPTYRKVNPADAPVLILALTSDTINKGEMYDAASSILQQKLAQTEGVGQVSVGGGALPAIRVDVNPTLLNSVGLGLEDIRQTLTSANANRPKGDIANGERDLEISTTDQLLKAAEYQNLVIAYRNGAAIPLSYVAHVTDSVEAIRTLGLVDGKPAV